MHIRACVPINLKFEMHPSFIKLESRMPFVNDGSQCYFLRFVEYSTWIAPGARVGGQHKSLPMSNLPSLS
jgi:hypothetical protein